MPALRTRMTARDTTESHRASSPLELLFDLTFVAAVSQIAAALAEGIEGGHPLSMLGPYIAVFFAIWWAWMNFTWFASAYDTDDVLYRVTTLVQMGGVLVLAAGVHNAVEGHFFIVTLGYLIMRVGLVSQWVRAAIQHPEGRRTALAYALGITIVQALWWARLLLPGGGGPWWLFAVLAVLDLSVPPIAERWGSTAWHPHHIAERYGLFTIILLGESVLASTRGVQSALETGARGELVIVAIAGLVLLFALWWLYFSEPAGEGLERNRGHSFFWGYGHYFVFAALAAIGAGLEASVASIGHEGDRLVLSYAVAIPVAIFLLLLWVLHAPIVESVVVPPAATIAAVVALLLVPLAALAIGAPWTLALLALVTVLLLAATLLRRTVKS